MNKDLHIPDCCGGGQPGDPAREPVYCSNTSRSWTREAWTREQRRLSSADKPCLENEPKAKGSDVC